MKLLARIIGAVVLGVGTLFGAKSATDQWTDPPGSVISAEEAGEESGTDEPR